MGKCILISKTSYVGIPTEFFVYVDVCVPSALIDFRRILTTDFGRDFSVEIVDGQNHCNRFKIEGILRYDLNGLFINFEGQPHQTKPGKNAQFCIFSLFFIHLR